MAVKFLGKNPHKKYVRQIPNRYIRHNVVADDIATVEAQQKIENKEKKSDKKMTDERLDKIEAIVGSKAPKRKIKVEKKDKGLIERTENSTILITEDNKVLLND